MASLLSRVVRLRTCTSNPPIRHVQRVLNPTRRPGLGLGLATIHRSLTTSSPSRPTISGLHASTIPLFLGEMPGQGRKSKSTISEPQPERASAVRRDDDAPQGPDHASGGEELDLANAAEDSPYSQDEADMRDLALMMPFFFFQTHFPEEDGFEHVSGPFKKELCYTELRDGGEEVAVTIPEDDTWFFQAARKGKSWTQVNGIKQGGAVWIALSMLPPAFGSSEAENGGMSEAAFGAVEQALLETFKQLQNPNFEGSKPVPDEWLEGCLAMVCVGSKTRVYEYSKAGGLCEPQADTGWMMLKAEEELRRKSGLPLRPFLREDAESLPSKFTNSQSTNKAQSEPGRGTDSPKEREVFSDGFPGVATPKEFVQSFYEHKIAKPAANNATSFYSLRKRALELPLPIFQSAFPKEDGFDHTGAGALERDVHYTEPTAGGGEEKVAVTIPWDNTGIYIASDPKAGGRITAFALCALPPAPAVASGSEPQPTNAKTPRAWGRGISDATMTAVSQELEEVIQQFQGPGYDGIPSAGQRLESCLVLVVVGLEMRVGYYSKEEGVRWSARGPVVEDGYGLAAASDPSHLRLPPRP